jgi:hypothetical protein
MYNAGRVKNEIKIKKKTKLINNNLFSFWISFLILFANLLSILHEAKISQ